MAAPQLLFARDASLVKPQLHARFAELVDPLVDAAMSGELATSRDAEKQLWTTLIEVGRAVMTVLFALMCRRMTDESLVAEELRPCDVKFRMDRDYWAVLTTTFGAISFSWSAYRHPRTDRTLVPARALLPLFDTILSSPLCLE